MIKLGLIGYPLKHSLSPVMQNAALAKKHIIGDYALYETETENLNEIIEHFKHNDFRGFNVTIPHKVAVMEHLDRIDKLAIKVGAVNTVVIEENQTLIGYNTDILGFIYAIPQDIRENLIDKKAAIIGSGGAARAVTAGMAEMDVSEIKIITLDSEMDKAQEIKELLHNIYPGLKLSCTALTDKADVSDCSLIVNATPVGMHGKFEGLSPLSEYSINSLPEDAFVYDIVYRPRKTKLLELAEARGLKTLDGLEMLVLQGAKAFQLWTGVEAPIDVMRSSIEQL